MMRVILEQLSQKMGDTNKSIETIKENNNKSSETLNINMETLKEDN